MPCQNELVSKVRRLCILTLLLSLSTAAQLLVAGPAQLSDKDVNQIKQRLAAYEAGKLSFDEISGTVNATNMALLTNMTVYFRMQSNEITTKMLLPISRSFAIIGRYSDSVLLAKRYLNVYSNDCRGWYVLSAAHAMAESHDEALEAGTNALVFGCEDNLTSIGADALRVNRMDVVENMVVPRMLAKKDFESDKHYKMEMVTFLTLYSLVSTNESLYIKALNGVKRSDVRDRPDLRDCVKEGCKLFKAKEAEQICKELIELPPRGWTGAEAVYGC
jgi:hypothetical protein